MGHREASQGLGAQPHKPWGPHVPTARGLTRRIKTRSFLFAPRSDRFSRKRGRRWHRMSPTASACHRPRKGNRNPRPWSPQTPNPNPSSSRGPRDPCEPRPRGVPGRKSQLRVRTGAKEGTGAGAAEKSPCKRRWHGIRVRDPRVTPRGRGECPALSPQGWGTAGKGHRGGTESVPPAVPLSPQWSGTM